MNAQSDSYESAVAMHGMTAAEYAEQMGCEIWDIPLADRLKLALGGSLTIAPKVAPAMESPPVPMAKVSTVPVEILPPITELENVEEIELDFNDEGEEETTGAEEIQIDYFADIADTLEVFGINSFVSRDSLTLSNEKGEEVEITRDKAEKSAYKAILASLVPLGLWGQRREIRTDWRMIHA